MTRWRLLLALLLFGSAGVYAATKSANPCSPDEVVVFSCAARQKIVALCASPELSKATSSLTYRVSVSGNRPELVYPRTKIEPAAAFHFGNYSYAKGARAQLAFEVNDFTYTLYSEHHAFEWSGSGVVVEKRGRRIAHLGCTERTIRNNLLKLIELDLPRIELRDLP
jgi:hypothetical protein